MVVGCVAVPIGVALMCHSFLFRLNAVFHNRLALPPCALFCSPGFSAAYGDAMARTLQNLHTG
jgi:hypothetical protein